MKIAMAHLNLAVESGDPRMAYLLAQSIKRASHHIVVYTARFDPKCFPDLHTGLDIREVPSRLGGAAANVGVVKKIAERINREALNTKAVRRIAEAMDNDFDIVICENDQSYKLGKFYGQSHPKAKIIWVMNNAPFRHTRKANLVMNLFSIFAAGIEALRARYYVSYVHKVVVHDEEQHRLAKAIGITSTILSIPVNFEKFYRLADDGKRRTESPTLLGVGSLTRVRCYEDIIAAGLALRRAGVDCRVALVCRDVWNNEAYRRELIGLARQDGDGRWADFRFDGVSDQELAALQAKSFVFVFPNHIRIWSMAAFEAMAAGLPLIVSNSTSVAEVLEDGKNALFVNPDAPDEIAAKVRFLIQRPKDYQRMALAGQEFVKENLNWDNYVARFLAA